MNKFISESSKWLQRQQTHTLIMITFLLLFVIWSIDYLMGPYLSTSLFYLIPVSFAAWWINRRVALGVALICAFVWLATDIFTNPINPNPLIPYWNATIRFGFFFVVALTLSSLQAARKRQEEMLAFIVHDLRSPTSNILMSLSFIKETAMPDFEKEKMIDSSISSSQKMLIQVNSLLDLNQLENNKLTVIKTAVQVATIVQQAMNEINSLTARKQLTMKTEGVTSDIMVLADEGLSVRILVNLLSNAIKFSPENGSIIVQTSRLTNEICFCICDDGPGIPLQLQKLVFNKYEQIQARKSGVATGSGLGLAFCKAAVEVQNGRIWLETPKNEVGTTICFTLPVSSPM